MMKFCPDLSRSKFHSKGERSIAIMGFRVAQSPEQAPFTSEFVGSILPIRTDAKRVGQRSAESRGFSPGAPVSSHRES